MKQLIKLFSKGSNVPKKVCREKHLVEMHSIWQDTGSVYYLLDTLKVTYLSESGLVTFEQISYKDIIKLIDKIYARDTDILSPKKVEHFETCVHISVCGVSWEHRSGEIRSKAIKDAAILRTLDKRFTQSQALFQHRDVMNDEGVNALTEVSSQDGIYKYSKVNLCQFIKQIETSNKLIPKELKQTLSITRSNFSSIFTEHEKNCLPMSFV